MISTLEEMGSTNNNDLRSFESAQKFWDSLFDYNVYKNHHENEDDLQGVSLMLASVRSIFRNRYFYGKDLEIQISGLQQENHLISRDCENLRKDLETCKNKYYTLEEKQKSPKQCSNCKVLEKEKQEQQIAFISAITAMQHDKSLRNVKPEVLLTQFLPETQLDFEPHKNLLQKRAEKSPEKRSESSPDEIEDTPELPKKGKQYKRRKISKSNTSPKKRSLMFTPQTKSEPFEGVLLAEETQPLNEKCTIPKNIVVPETLDPSNWNTSPKKRTMMFTPQTKREPFNGVFLAEETQPLNEKCTIPKNIVVPETLDPSNCEFNLDCIKKESDNLNEPEDEKKFLADLSTDAVFPTTPPKADKNSSSYSSPILGVSSSKKSFQNLSARTDSIESKPSPSLLKKPVSSSKLSLSNQKTKTERNKVGRLKIDKKNYISTIVKRNGETKREKQAVLNFSREDRKANNTDLSKLNEFNGGQRFKRKESDDGFDQAHLDWAMKDSIMKSDEAPDNDETMFEPIKPEYPAANNDPSDECDLISASSSPNARKNSKKRSSSRNSLSRMAINESKKSPEKNEGKKVLTGFTEDNIQGSTLDSFNPLASSTLRQDVDLNSSRNIKIDRDIQKTFPSSVINQMSQNPHLAALIEEFDENKSPEKLMSSFDRLPKKGPTSPKYRYKGNAVRKKVDRLNLPGWSCDQCEKFFRAQGYHDPNHAGLRNVLNKCSRHRDKYGMRPPSPKSLWNTGFPPTLPDAGN